MKRMLYQIDLGANIAERPALDCRVTIQILRLHYVGHPGKIR